MSYVFLLEKSVCIHYRLRLTNNLFSEQSPPRGATIPYRPKPQVTGPVILANGQAFTIQGNYAVPTQEVCRWTVWPISHPENQAKRVVKISEQCCVLYCQPLQLYLSLCLYLNRPHISPAKQFCTLWFCPDLAQLSFWLLRVFTFCLSS